MLIIFPTILLVFSYVTAQQLNIRKSECCICRRNISNNEELIVCPDCQTIYHRTHLSLWLKIRNKCPICKNKIRNRYTASSITKDLTQQSVISLQRKCKVNIRSSPRGDSFVLECPHCKNILESQIYGVLSQCQVCGSRISWINDLESRIKNLDNPILNFERNNSIRLNKNRRSGNRKISYRTIQRQKAKKREFFRKKLQKEALLESQDQMLSLNLTYSRNRTNLLKYQQYIPLRMMEDVEKKEYSRKENISGLKFLITLIVVVLIFIFISMFI
ncbi:MAG: RING finger protein [Candidatus Hodarchaeota archaeon]